MWSHWKVLGLLLTGVVLLATGCSGGSLAGGGGYIPNSISVSGIGEASGAPDVAYVQLGINVVNADVGRAVTEANNTMTKVRDAVVAAGVDTKDLQTLSFSVWPEDRYDPQTGQPTGERVYHVENMLRITVRDINQVSTVIEAGLDAGANNVYGLNFGIDDTSALEAEARTEAVADARARAEQLAQALGVKLGDPIVVSEVYGAVPVLRMPYDIPDAGGFGGGVPVEQGELAVTAQVYITFSISQ